MFSKYHKGIQFYKIKQWYDVFGRLFDTCCRVPIECCVQHLLDAQWELFLLLKFCIIQTYANGEKPNLDAIPTATMPCLKYSTHQPIKKFEVQHRPPLQEQVTCNIPNLKLINKCGLPDCLYFSTWTLIGWTFSLITLSDVPNLISLSIFISAITQASEWKRKVF